MKSESGETISQYQLDELGMRNMKEKTIKCKSEFLTKHIYKRKVKPGQKMRKAKVK